MAIQLRRGNEAELTESNLLAGEVAYCLDTKRLVVGDGEGGANIVATGAELEALTAAEKGAANGIASLDSNGNLEQLPQVLTHTVSIGSGWGSSLYLYKQGNTVICNWVCSVQPYLPTTWTVLPGTIPEGFRPIIELEEIRAVFLNGRFVDFIFSPSGTITIVANAEGVDTFIPGRFVWPTA